MTNYYRLVNKDNKLISERYHNERVIPDVGQLIILRNVNCTVLKVTEDLNFDEFERTIVIYVDKL